ncbi:4-hydroxythreonine-4-phosphate dehydrogenase (plasmid) [Legionella adelaidensis]|uniref:4-hydroxythreonine-4-phosphate dehydrogenase n=1 Tax=Legionella adelaidensis TaxID=45056 RepID=A0A0W0R1D3_9GAMM|nr:4-hydroxythreonine-4-phosphate dehydrogenase PdxA [Legionella adelaidensis]KTC64899.1 4-hydroxythreonine-4-phosphate dehydrogenase [Legionella adelaidensis]VEH82929.1 4-hydroxythreonine-4-phosphate dehydrogenase [Legionella adelaidensis]
MKPLLISSGEPAGIGPDICLALAKHQLPVVIAADIQVLQQRAHQLKLPLSIKEYQADQPLSIKENQLTVLPIHCPYPVEAGKLNPGNASYVLEMLKQSIFRCLKGEFAGLVTAPVHKAVINEAGFIFTGHTEFLQSHCNSKKVVMLLANSRMKVALATIHLPLREVPEAINETLLIEVIDCLHSSLQVDFGIKNPTIHVAGLNPHAGESGYLGKEEIETIIPVLKKLQKKGIGIKGPFPVDTMFTPIAGNACDAYIAMYHDQGLPVIKYADFHETVNVTLGLPIIRTSVDHGTALEIAGKGVASEQSLKAAVEMAILIAKNRSEK